MRAITRCDLDSFDEDPPHREEDGLRHTRARIEKTFHGDIEGYSPSRVTTCGCSGGCHRRRGHGECSSAG